MGGQALALPAARDARAQSAPPPPAETDWFDARQAAHTRAEHRTAVLDRPGTTAAPQHSTGWDLQAPPEPFACGFGDCVVVGPLDQLGPNWLLAGWSVVPSAFYIVRDTEIEGWVERGLGGGNRWFAIRGGAFLGDVTTQQPLLHPTPEQAAHTVSQARDMGL